ncbi:MAG TPA: geranylgeranyl pyrophosphate synthase, partial [Acidimicrobiaceae bacterium]|nr:geranylgeranyl pyrophosphate synthase [Acidimicrobiaceae bacterium]
MGAVSSLSPLQARPDAPDDLARIESALAAATVADDAFLTEMASHLIPAGGKRLRPAFVVAAALCERADGDASGVVSDEMIRGGVAVELVHLGSLYHDDVMDDAETRRGIEAVNHRWGNLKAILAGDFLLAKASELAASLGTEVAELLAATIGRLCEGQVRELQLIYDVDRTEAQYLDAIRGKTAELYATACRIGALVAGAGDDCLARLREFGLGFGMAFQIVDDVLDLVSTSERLGKPVGNDLREGVYTLPVLRTLASADGAGDELRRVLADGRPECVGPLEDARRAQAHEIVLAGGEVESSVRTAETYVRRAVDALDGLAPTPTCDGMR